MARLEPARRILSAIESPRIGAWPKSGGCLSWPIETLPFGKRADRLQSRAKEGNQCRLGLERRGPVLAGGIMGSRTSVAGCNLMRLNISRYIE